MSSHGHLLRLALTLFFLALGGAGGALADLARLPMPWLLGSLAVTAVAVGTLRAPPLAAYRFPQEIRAAFVALIGVMIGTQVTPELFRDLATLPYTLVALALFVVLAHAGNTLIFQRIGGYDRATAFYSGTPGGLMESIAFGEGAGADVRLLTMQQFLRIILVITLVPTAVSIWTGGPVGSAAGVVPGAELGPVEVQDLAVIVAAAAAGLWIARFIHLPAAQIMGPLLLSAVLTLTGRVDLHLPFWLIATAQAVIGVGLGMRFAGVTARMVGRCLWLSILSVAFMLALGSALAMALWQLTGMGLLQLLLSFAPGGVTEMSVIALGLSASPALVSLHHVLRILMTVAELSVASRLLGLRGPEAREEAD
ncbi:AbrB family transcriptional regulator [Roseivivax isoporae]|uniref:Aminopeptidase n=1 Tax=Roseivivax isoporae LMG 25204 TaxID=1449351 RepID=X7FB28_9RHOB|nr:AbrB family transcriptional regulator [Roseivivax isoporae]ETX30087.1 aminopeptidase [Roseivivax isoporae LMG 25204]